MGRYAVLAVSIIAMCGAALGQTPADEMVIEGPWGGRTIDYEARPNGRDFATNYPRVALGRAMGGNVILCCKAKPDRTLQCRVGAEWPTADWKFGEASLRIANKFRLSPESYETVTAFPEAELKVAIRWNIEGGSGDRRYEQSLQNASDIMGRALICQGYRHVTPTS